MVSKADIIGQDPVAVPEAIDFIFGDLKSAEGDISLLKKELDGLAEGKVIDWTPESNWNTHAICEMILEQSGPADVYLTGYAIKDFVVRQFVRMKELKLINSFHGLFSDRIRTECPDAAQMLAANFDSIFLKRIHAKVMVIRNGRFGVVVKGSANPTRNPSIESGFIVISKKLADLNIEWIERYSDNSKKLKT